MDIKEIAYEVYKQHLVETCVTMVDRRQTFLKYLLYRADKKNNKSFESWLEDRGGYDKGLLYPSFDDFCKKEYKQEGYMRSLLRLKPLRDMYHEDIKNMKGE